MGGGDGGGGRPPPPAVDAPTTPAAAPAAAPPPAAATYCIIRRRPLYHGARRLHGARGAVSFVSVLDRPTFFMHPLAHLLSCGCPGARLLNDEAAGDGCGPDP